MDRALEAQKNIRTQRAPMTMNQTMNSPLPTRNTYLESNMNRWFMMQKKMTFEEKYNVNPQTQIETFDLWVKIEEEDLSVPPSLEEDPNQSSPLPPDVKNASDMNLDEFIANAEKEEEESANEPEEPKVPLVQQQEESLWEATIRLLQTKYETMTVKDLRDEYLFRWWDKDLSKETHKQRIINLILDLVRNGSQKEEE